MTGRERVRAALDRREPDRVPVNFLGTAEVEAALAARFGCDRDGILDRLGVDLRTVDPPYAGPALRRFPDGTVETEWGYTLRPVRYRTGVYMEAHDLPYARFRTREDVERFRWPDPDWWDWDALARRCERAGDSAAVLGSPGVMDLINGVARGRGVERVLLDIATEDEVGLACMRRRAAFYLAYCRRGLEAAGGRIDILHIGDDYGHQGGLLMSPDAWRRLFRPYLEAFVDLGHAHGARVMLHCCGSSTAIMGDFVEIGLDVLDTVQPEARGMDPAALKRRWGDRLAFHGTVSTQRTLPFGSVEDVRREVRQRIEVVGRGGGLILAPSHNFQPDTPLENILAMYREAGSLRGGV